jgi:superfamily II DNA or RNA helicase
VRVSLLYDNGTIIIKGLAYVPYAKFDPRVNEFRAVALHYSDIIDYLKSNGIPYTDNVMNLIPMGNVKSNVVLRDYQQEALKKWIEAGMRGCIVLPTGSGKTLIGIKAIEHVNLASIIVVPTIELMNQWVKVLIDSFSLSEDDIGKIGGGYDSIGAVTVITYDSAYIRASTLGNRFALMIFDEVHHLPATGYRSIAEQSIAPYRLGLTATIEREDNMHTLLPSLVGGIVYRAKTRRLIEDNYLAEYRVERRYVKMDDDEAREYISNYDIYIDTLSRLNLPHGIEGFKRLIMLSSKNPAAREALLARNRALSIALNSRAKLDELKEVLAEHYNSKVIIFTHHNELVYRIASEFLIPFITHNTSIEERRDILQGFREGRYNAIVTSRVLDEGIDVPDADLGIIMSGTGSSREFIQRLGRLLRAREGKRALLIEIVSKDSVEVRSSRKRKRRLTDT